MACPVRVKTSRQPRFVNSAGLRRARWKRRDIGVRDMDGYAVIAQFRSGCKQRASLPGRRNFYRGRTQMRSPSWKPRFMTSHSGNRAVTRRSKKYSCKMVGGRHEASVFVTSGRSCNGRVQLRRFRAIEPTGWGIAGERFQSKAGHWVVARHRAAGASQRLTRR